MSRERSPFGRAPRSALIDSSAFFALANDQDKNHRKAFSLTDALSFAVMERLDIHHVFTLDQDFAQYGWTIVGSDRGP